MNRMSVYHRTRESGGVIQKLFIPGFRVARISVNLPGDDAQMVQQISENSTLNGVGQPGDGKS